MADIDAKARQVVTSVMAGQYQAASADFTANARRTFTAACLAQVHDDLIRDYGTVQAENPPAQSDPAKRNVTVVVHFAGGTDVGGEVSFDKSDRVTKIFFARPTKPSGGPPAACASR